MELTKENLSPRAQVNLFYSLLAGGANTKLLESLVNFNLPEIIDKKKHMSENEIIEELELHPIRARKWLFLLTRQGFLKRKKTVDGFIYSLGDISKNLFSENWDRWWFFKQMTYSWQSVSYENFYEVLKGAKVSFDAHWPPKNEEETIAIEEWMSRTSEPVLKTIEAAINLSEVSHLLDVGGGDGNMACQLANKYPRLKVTIYNLPRTIELAKENIKLYGVGDRVKVVEGDFLKEKELPKGFDLILFSRVLCDWSIKTATNLLQMSYKSLLPGGRVAICEAFQEENKDFSIAWEMRYIFWDELEEEVFKSSRAYKKILVDLGYKIGSVSKMQDDSIYAVLTAKKLFWFNPIQKLINKHLSKKLDTKDKLFSV